jgi:superfamily II DNA/RNA helicase
MPSKIRQLARAILKDPAEINIAISKPPEKIVQKAFVVYEPQKLPLVKHLLKTLKYKNALIFCSRKQNVKQLTRELKHGGITVGEIHSDLEQAQREEVLAGFINGRIPVMVATDILSRGIDIDTIDVVINYDVPHDGEDYVHRIGRTARADGDGMAFTLISDKEHSRFAAIESLLGKEVEKAPVPEQLGPAPSYHPRVRTGGGGKGKRPQRSFHRGKPHRR